MLPLQLRLILYPVFALVCLLNVCIMRNAYNGDLSRVFDASFVASMPRYYYLPSAAMAICIALSFMELKKRFATKQVYEWLMHSVLVIFLCLGAIEARSKVDYLVDNMASEVFLYVPEVILRPPATHPSMPSFRKLE